MNCLPSSGDTSSGTPSGLKVEPPDPVSLSPDQVATPDKSSSILPSEESRVRDFEIPVVKMEPPDPVSHDQEATPDKSSSILQSEESRDVEIPVVKMEPPDPLSHDPVDPLSHDQVAYQTISLEIKQEDDDMIEENPGENKTLAGRRVSSSDVREVTGSESLQEGETGIGSSSIHCCIVAENATDADRPFKCMLCSETFYDMVAEDHERAKDDGRPKKIEQSCLTFESSRVTSKEDVSCTISKKACTHKRTPLKGHTRTQEKPFSCSICKVAFTRKSHLSVHSRIHTGEKPLSCSICQKGFSQKGNLTKHMRTHTGEKPFSCSICQKGFSQKSKLADHMNIHTGERPYSCSICKKAFSRKGYLHSHMAIHDYEGLVRCNICKEYFTQNDRLKDHMMTHTGV